MECCAGNHALLGGTHAPDGCVSNWIHATIIRRCSERIKYGLSFVLLSVDRLEYAPLLIFLKVSMEFGGSMFYCIGDKKDRRGDCQHLQ